MRIPCPICGERDLGEFTYGGDATISRPPMDESDPQVWNHFVYNRENPRGPHYEYWQHTGGCRAWIKVQRNVVTHEIETSELVGPWAKASQEDDAATQREIAE